METPPGLPEDVVPADPELVDALTKTAPAGDAALVDILTKSTAQPTELLLGGAEGDDLRPA